LTKRQFIVGASAIVARDLASSCHAEAGPALRPLPIPNLVEPAKLGGHLKLTVESGKHEFFEGKLTKTYGYSGQILGPTIRVRRGDVVQVAVENRLDHVTTTHWHGVLVPGQYDGGPHQLINPGATWRPTLKIDQPAATAWYHPHPHNDTARQVYMGLSGILIIEDDLSLSLDLPADIRCG
jgi:cuproxidase